MIRQVGGEETVTPIQTVLIAQGVRLVAPGQAGFYRTASWGALSKQ